MRALDFFKAALVLTGEYILSWITGGRIPYFIFYMSLGILIFDLIWAITGARVTASSWVETCKVQAGTKIRVFTEIKNNSRWPLPWVQCWIKMPGTFGLPDNMCCYTFSLRAYETKIVTEEMDCGARGIFPWGECFIRVGGILGFFINTKTSGQQREIEVMPRLFNMSGLGIKSKGHGKLIGPPRSVRESTGLFGIRNYTSADGISRVHWKISARYGQLKVKHYQQADTDSYTLVLDNCREIHIGDGPDASFEKAVSLAASVAVSVSRAGSRISLNVYRPDESSLNSSVKTSGRSNLTGILRVLTIVGLKDTNVGLGDITNAIESAKGGDSRIIWITGNLDEKTVQTLLKKAYFRNSIVFLLELETFGKVGFDLTGRQKAVCRLRGSGIKVVSVDKDADLRLVMGRSLHGIG